MAELTRVHVADSLDAVNVVFIHGLGGDVRETWMSNPLDHTTLWPKWIGEDAQCNVWLLKYGAALSGWTDSAMHLSDLGAAFMSALLYEKALAGRRLILVGHSLGGLVIKAGLVHASTLQDQSFLPVLRCVSAIVFVGTPHQGSTLATVAAAVSGVLRTNPQVHNMREDDAWLKILNGQFQKLQSDLKFQVKVFFETQGVFLGRKVWGFGVGPRVTIVDRNSSDPQIPGVTPIPLDYDHIQIAKPKSREAIIYKAMLVIIEALPASTQTTEKQPNVLTPKPAAKEHEDQSYVVKHSLVDEKPAASSLRLTHLRQLARELLDGGLPSSITSLFPDAPIAASQALIALTSFDRVVVEVGDAGENSFIRCPLRELATSAEPKHLVVATPGSGKTHALWHLADRLLEGSDIVPLFLPLGGVTTWDQVKGIITDLSPDLSPDMVVRDPRVCLCIDGWSEFAAGENIGEKSIALRVLQGSRIIANARYADVGDTAFKVWTLEPFPSQLVAQTVAKARPGQSEMPSDLLDLLRLPLLLSLYVLSGNSGSATGALLHDFHNRLARNMPERFSDALSRAVAAVTISGGRSYSRLVSQLRIAATQLGIAEPVRLLESLGSITNRGGLAVPVHDLYWSWLCGCGLLQGIGTCEAINQLSTRESYSLALQSGQPADPSLIVQTVASDLLLAAEFDASTGLQQPHPAIVSALDRAFSDSRLAVRGRAALASLLSQRPQYLRQALDILSELYRKKAAQPIWIHALEITDLFAQRGIVCEWLGSPGTEYLLDAIARTGGANWVDWLEQMASAGKITWEEALATALACSHEIPRWGIHRLDDLYRDAPWKLKLAAKRRSNAALAMTIAQNYGRIIDEVISRGSSGWLDINQVILDCGEDRAFDVLLAEFGNMSPDAQKLLAYVIVDLGDRWVAEFQKVAFARPGKTHHHKLEEVVSPDIDDETARQWIAAGHHHIGWRVLIARHGVTMLPALIADLPPTFDNVHVIPALEHMAYLDSAPDTLIPEIWSRFKGQMQPKAVQDALAAVAKAKPGGMRSIVDFLSRASFSLPQIYLEQVLRLYAAWQRETHSQIQIDTGAHSFPFDVYVVSHVAYRHWDSHFAPGMLARIPELAIDFVLNHCSADDGRKEEVLTALKSVKSYHPELFEEMVATPKLAALIPRVFSESFESFPESAVIRAIDCEDINQEQLLYQLSKSSNPLHRRAHAVLIERVLENEINLNHYRYVGNCLRAHPRYDLINLLKDTVHLKNENAVWFIRQVEVVRGELFIDESGQFLA
ncbi:alpha/beta fold hydrolase [Pseudomonas sp. SG20052]|uniref:alpha/beta fold hydrolase n=1 Tax=Pseudomonas sp. SG20052 TaxID=3074147 RepID=UPI00287F60D0|nr:alpha/beta fold hydrolase [Pseudomonas sp. SG20052]WNF55717.1 alpha/beta fold hydrolase [Pseudomonas sp. SG20052]